jgi:hypothetical protein
VVADREGDDGRARNLKIVGRMAKRIANYGLALMGRALRILHVGGDIAHSEAKVMTNRKRGIIRRFMNTNIHLMSMSFNKLLEEFRMSRHFHKEKMRFIIKSITDQNLRFLFQSYFE